MSGETAVGALVCLIAALTLGSDEPALVGSGVISTELNEFGSALTPDGRELYFALGLPQSYGYAIVKSEWRGHSWTAPEIVPFSGRYRDFDPFITPDGRHVLFASDRPLHGEEKRDYDLWIADRAGRGWSEPRPLPAPVNGPANEVHPSMTSDGTLYFGSTRDGGLGGYDIYRAVPKPGGGFADPENLGPAINSAEWDVEPTISRDERFLVFTSWLRPDGVGGEDLYVSERRDGHWTPARNAGTRINSPARDYSPALTPDGNCLMFSSERTPPSLAARLSYRDILTEASSVLSGLGNLYVVRVSALGVGPASGPCRVPDATESAPPASPPSDPVPSALFGPGAISTRLDEADGALSPDGREFAFTVHTLATTNAVKSAICLTRWNGERWSEPEVAPFSGVTRDGGPVYSPDGNWIYFFSNRGVNAKPNLDLWRVPRTALGWGPPERLPEPVNSDAAEVTPGLAADGTIYFSSDRPGGFGSLDLYRAVPEGSGYRVENLGPRVNTETLEVFPYPSPDDTTLAFASVGRADAIAGAGAPYDRADIYVTRRGADGWSAPEHLPPPVNSAASDSAPRFSWDGGFLFVASERGFETDRLARRVTYAEWRRAFDGILNSRGNIWRFEWPLRTQ